MVDRAILDHWALADAEVRPIGTGLINRTFEVVAGGRPRAILQQVNPIFDPGIHHNIVAVTEHLAGKGLTTPRLIPTRDGAAWATHPSDSSEGGGEVWRLQTAVPGVSVDALTAAAQAEAAGRFVGRWHAALDDLEHEFVARRAGVHDTPRHLATLRDAADEASTGAHPLAGECLPLATALLDAAAALDPLPAQAERVAHGDLKISNLMFADAAPVALVDLDTVAPMSLAYELGDAWRSWCNRATEDQPAALDLELFAASLRGWRAGYGRPLTGEDRQALLLGPEWISLELSARFAADAVFERYFGWNPERYPTRGAHNLARARGQWSLHQALIASRQARAALLDGLDR